MTLNIHINRQTVAALPLNVRNNQGKQLCTFVHIHAYAQLCTIIEVQILPTTPTPGKQWGWVGGCA